MPRTSNIKKIASALKVSVTYLMDKDETDPEKHIEQNDLSKLPGDEFGSKGAKEAQDVIHRAGRSSQAGSWMKKQGSVFPVADGSLSGFQTGSKRQIYTQEISQKPQAQL